MTDGLKVIAGYLSRGEQEALRDTVLAVIQQAPLFVSCLPRTGKPMSVRMTNCGALGWVSDALGGYRYQATHPETGRPWPQIPEQVTRIWDVLADYPAPPEACLVNYYGVKARMGLHRDQDEADLSAPVISVSLGDEAQFRIGGSHRRDASHSVRLRSGDVVVLGGKARRSFHGIDRIYPGTSSLLPQGGRLSLTLRRVTRP